MTSNSDRLARVANYQTLKLTHYGRKSGQPYDVTIWYMVEGGRLFLASANVDRQWVRNVKARPRVSLRIGDHIFNGEVRAITEPQEREHVIGLVERKYWWAMPMIRFARLFQALGLLKDNSGAFEVALSDS